MATYETTSFLAGVIEGFYGQPWSQAERLELFGQMTAWGLNTYLYAPKDDLKHRALWRKLYSSAETESLRELIHGCQQRKLRFIYALSPGLDIRYSQEADLEQLQRRFDQMLGLGGQNFALLFDDIPDRMSSEDQKRWGSFASAQCHVANAMFKWVRERSPQARFLFCPTPYCGRMAERKHGGEGYLATVGRELLPEIDVFWTGPEIISREIPVRHIRDLQTLLRRKPLIWDNLHANDYDGRRFYCGPYAGRPLELRGEVAGLLTNPNCEFALNYVPLRTLAEFVRCEKTWDARQAYRSAMREWLTRFATVGQPVTLEDLIRFGDCFYLPYEEGLEAETLYQLVSSLIVGVHAPLTPALSPSGGVRVAEGRVIGSTTAVAPAEEWRNQVAAFRQRTIRLREFCVRMTELEHRPLFYALSRRVWELREELDLLEKYVEFKSKPGQSEAAFGSDFHLPGTYRGGLVARLQRLLVLQPDGTFTPSHDHDRTNRNRPSDPTA
jgi:protein O-GlcNAcase/histone acetyltransferase